MTTKIFIICVLFAAVILCASVYAKSDNQESPKVSFEKDGTIRVDFIHYAGKAVGGKPGTQKCYSLMGPKWNSLPVTYSINPANFDGLSQSEITSAISSAATTWDLVTGSNLFNPYTLGPAQYGQRDSTNAISFGPMSDNNIIAVTRIWYYQQKRVGIVEFDILFNDYYLWGTSGDAGYMDLQNIATHELGHGLGLNDIYTSACSAVTMYGLSWYGDIEKMSLEQPDITGIQLLYGR